MAIQNLLVESGLPVADLSLDKLERFLVAEGELTVAGLIGLEVFGATGLLRSLVVSPSVRGSGLGGQLVNSLEVAAKTAGVAELWLLTIDAQQYFEQRGYQLVDRSRVPAAIASTAEFGGLCPDSAHLMMKLLA